MHKFFQKHLLEDKNSFLETDFCGFGETQDSLKLGHKDNIEIPLWSGSLFPIYADLQKIFVLHKAVSRKIVREEIEIKKKFLGGGGISSITSAKYVHYAHISRIFGGGGQTLLTSHMAMASVLKFQWVQLVINLTDIKNCKM